MYEERTITTTSKTFSFIIASAKTDPKRGRVEIYFLRRNRETDESPDASSILDQIFMHYHDEGVRILKVSRRCYYSFEA